MGVGPKVYDMESPLDCYHQLQIGNFSGSLLKDAIRKGSVLLPLLEIDCRSCAVGGPDAYACAENSNFDHYRSICCRIGTSSGGIWAYKVIEDDSRGLGRLTN